ncbi:MAG: nitrate- and nitrite sensing domain-containing protein [Micromonosporaceae bacterium]
MIPILAILGLTVVRSVASVNQIISADETRAYARVSQWAAQLNHALQSERAAAAIYLTDSGESAHDLRARGRVTNGHVTAFRDALRGLRSPQSASLEVLDRVDSQLDGLAELRTKVVAREELPRSTAIFRYRTLIADLITYRESLAQISGDSEVADLARGAAALSSFKEHIAQQQVVGTIVLAKDSVLTPARQEAFLATVAGQAETRRAFDDAVDDRHVADLQLTLAGTNEGEKPTTKDSMKVADRIAADIRRTLVGDQVKLSKESDVGDWERAMRVRLDLVREVEKRIDAEFTEKVNKQRNELWRQVLIEFFVVTIALLVLILVNFLTARSMARSLQWLREDALAVAYESLPQSVARLRKPETLGKSTPDEVAASLRDRVQVRGRDEIGQVAQAFNVVHREAVRIAAEQAKLRADVATMFVNLARRSRVLVDRLIGSLDRLEGGEEDPDRLAQLFQLDHLATRMRRNDENLLVLAGADAIRAQREPAPLYDVLRAAQSEVEHYTRIEFGIVDGDVEVAAHAVNDIVHLLAELCDNATAFSPPDTAVLVDARRAGDRVILQIEDRGIGMSTEQLEVLNTRLASPPLMDVTVSGMMGLVVVGRLAARHDISVELRPAQDRGTVADVILPADTLILPERLSHRQRMVLPYTRASLALGVGDPSYGRDMGRDGSAGFHESGLPAGSAEGMYGPGSAGADPWSQVPDQPPYQRSPAPDNYMGSRLRDSQSRSYADTDPFAPDQAGRGPSRGGADPYQSAHSSPPGWHGDQPPVTYPRGDSSHPTGGLDPDWRASADRRRRVTPSPGASDVDQMTELPIFRDLESAWFRSKQPGPVSPGAVPPAGSGNGAATPHGVAPDETPSAAAPPAAQSRGWNTAADDGWRRATAIADNLGGDGAETTETGLPKRVPMAQLVPGGIDTAATTTQRSPEAVRGLLSAYHRGVRRGREQSPGRNPGDGGVEERT